MLMLKWRAVQIITDVIIHMLSFTSFLLACCGLEMIKFYNFGLNKYPIRIPHTPSLQFMLENFWSHGLWPILSWLPYAMVADALVRIFFWRMKD